MVGLEKLLGPAGGRRTVETDPLGAAAAFKGSETKTLWVCVCVCYIYIHTYIYIYIYMIRY